MSNLYNMMHGTTPATFFIVPMLGMHPDEIPRYRDCFLMDSNHPEYNNHIFIYTRVGGGNRGQDYGEEDLIKHPNYADTYDNPFDNTYGMYVFSVPEKWQEDFDLIIEGKLPKISKKYKDELYRIFPRLSENFDEIFKGDKNNE